MDALNGFLEDVFAAEGGVVAAADLYRAYVAWARAEGDALLSQKALARHLRERGYENTRTSQARLWRHPEGARLQQWSARGEA